MDEKNTNHPEGCRCWLCRGHGACCGGRHHWLWLILKILIIVIIFCFGVKVGELKVLIGDSWGYGGHYNLRTMMGGGNYNYGPNGGYLPMPMMGWYWPSATSTQK